MDSAFFAKNERKPEQIGAEWNRKKNPCSFDLLWGKVVAYKNKPITIVIDNRDGREFMCVSHWKLKMVNGLRSFFFKEAIDYGETVIKSCNFMEATANNEIDYSVIDKGLITVYNHTGDAHLDEALITYRLFFGYIVKDVEKIMKDVPVCAYWIPNVKSQA